MFKNFFIFLLVLLIFSTLPVQVSAQGINPVFIPFCFKSVRCDKTESGCTKKSGHIARLTIESGKGPEVNSKVYVVNCLSSSDGQHCTSGNTAIDSYLSYSPMPEDLGYRFQGLFTEDGKTPINQTPEHTLITNAAGTLLTNEGANIQAMEWHDYTPEGHERQFLGISEIRPQPTITAGLGLGGQQQGEIPKFDFSVALKECLPLVWDPDGVVFDSQSLEPIPGSLVTLTKKRADGTFSFVDKFNPDDVPSGILKNPYLTLEDGGFSFFVPDGTYKLTPNVNGYDFPGVLTLNSNYSKVYTNIYPLLSGIEIIEKGGPQHRNIPVDSFNRQPTFFPIKFMEYSYQSDRVSKVFIKGRVSHPLATINAYSVIPDPNNFEAKIRYKILGTIQADKVGRFFLTVDQSTLDKNNNEMFGEIEAMKADFGLSTKDNNKIPAILKLNPILTYIEGGALKDDKLLSEAKVQLFLNTSTKPYYETVTDSQGYFKIPSDYIPFMPYKLRYLSEGSITDITTSKFIIDNSDYIKNNRTNLYYPQFNNPKINDTIKNSTTIQNRGLINNLSDSKEINSKKNQSASKNLIFIGVIFIIIIFLIGAGALGVYIIKKNQSLQLHK